MDAQVELPQAIQRNEVHALDQLAQLLAQVLAGVALDRQVQVLGQPTVGLGDAGVQPHGLRRGNLGEEGGQLVLARIQRRGAGLQGVEIDHFFHEHDLGPFQASTDLGQFLLHRRALALDHTPVFLGRLLIARHRQGDGFRRDQVRLHPRQHTALHRGRGDDLAVGAGAAVAVGAADILAAVQDHGRAAEAALHQPGQQALGLAALGRGKGGKRRLAALDAGPEVVVDDPQVRDWFADPLFRRVQHRGATTGVRVLAITAAIEHARADVKFLVQDAIPGSTVAMDARRRPSPAPWPGLAGGVQGVGDGARRFSSGVALEDREDDTSLVLIDDQRALAAEIVAEAAAPTTEAGLHPRDQTAAGLLAQFH